METLRIVFDQTYTEIMEDLTRETLKKVNKIRRLEILASSKNLQREVGGEVKHEEFLKWLGKSRLQRINIQPVIIKREAAITALKDSKFGI